MNDTIIIQTSPARTASTLLSNALYGLFVDFSNQPIMFVEYPDKTNTDTFNFINKLSSVFNSIDELNYILWKISKCFKGINEFKEFNFFIGNGFNEKNILFINLRYLQANH